MADSAPLCIPGAPAADLDRSPAARAVGELAAASELALFHFEHRLRLPLPDEWAPEDRPDLTEPPTWVAGRLPESKYQSFRHDLLLGSFHPGHRAKWTAHELCHGLVGFAWRADGTRLFHALAARLAEVVPVALWYFFDEAGLRRCEAHAGQGPLYSSFCAACEDRAARGRRPADATDDRWHREGRAFVERELAAIARSRRVGRPVAHRLVNVELCEDGLAYAGAHAGRLASEQMERYATTFFQPGEGWFDSLEALEARVVELLEHVTGGAPARPWRGGRWRWIAQDIGWRLLQVGAETDGECGRELDGLVSALAEAPGAGGVAAAVSAYTALHDEYELPAPADVFAVGYDLPGALGRAFGQVRDGIASACPGALTRLGLRADDAVRRFVADDGAEHRRVPVGRRFAAWLGEAGSDPEVVEVARCEAALRHLPPGDPEAAHLGGSDPASDRVRLAGGVELLRLTHDARSLLVGDDDGWPLRPLAEPRWIALTRAPGGDLRIVELGDAAAAALRALERVGSATPSEHGLDPGAVAELAGLGLAVPCEWRLASVYDRGLCS